jgi:predicted transcriptional regulator
MAPQKPQSTKLLTELELLIMNAVWDLGECTVREVQERMAGERDLAYTTVATMMKILEQKKFLKARKKEKAHVYAPAVAREDYETASLEHIKENVFMGRPSALVARLLDDGDLSADELQRIRQLLDEKLK